MRKIVNLRSRLYQNDPQRNVETPGAQSGGTRHDVLLQAMLDDLDWQRFFRRCERRANLLQSGLVHIVGNGWKGLPSLRFHSLARVWVRQHPGYPNDIDAALGVAIELPDQDDEYAVADDRADARFLRYLPVEVDGKRTGWRMDLTDRGGTVFATYAGEALRKGDADRPYLPFLPLVKVDVCDGDEFYPVGNDGLVDEALAIALREADMGAALSLAALPMLQARGYSEDDAASISVGPGKVVHHGDPEARLEWLSAQTDWEAIDAVNERNLKRFLITEGVPPTEADLEPEWRSGRALHAARQMLYEERADAMDRWRDHEQAVFAKLARFNRWWFGDMGAQPTMAADWATVDWRAYKLKVTFPNPGPLLSEEERDELWQKRIAAGLATAEEYRQKVLGETPAR